MILASIVLAGGHGQRMGQPKAALPWRDSTLLLDRIETLLRCTHPVVVVARDEDQELPPLHTECELTFDTSPGEGPLGGVLAGMRFCAEDSDAVLVLAVDLPFVDERVVGWLADQLGERAGVVPVSGGKPQPLCAIYRTSLLQDIEALVASGERAAQALVRLPGVATLDDAPPFDRERRFLFNLNTPEDLERARRWMS
jgi:molybdopterin-guanine dinucleotide biosynthesis protein A